MTLPLLLALCTPDATYTPTPTVKWDQQDRSTTRAYVICFKRPEDAVWACSPEIPTWQGEFEVSEPSYPGVTIDYPVQRLTSQQWEEVMFDVRNIGFDGSMGRPSNIITVCMPRICTRYGPCN